MDSVSAALPQIFKESLLQLCKRFDPGARVLCVEGDSAFGFSGMELETIARYKLPITLVIINNNGIYSGFETELYQDLTKEDTIAISSPPTALLPMVKYNKMAEMVELHGETVKSKEEISSAMRQSFNENS